jgi:hypothetical protein
VFRIEAEMHQRIVPFAGFEDDVAAAAAVTAARPPARDEFLAPEGQAAVATIASLYVNAGFVNEHGRK